MYKRLSVAGLLVVVLAARANAHETWMMPSEFASDVGAEARFDVSSGMAFPRLESPIRTERVAKAAYRLRGRVFEIKSAETEAASLVLRQVFADEGTAAAWLDLKPKDIELTDEKVEEYFAEINAPEKIRKLWAARKGRIAWKETYTKHAKTFVRVGRGGGDGSWRTPVGSALELVPMSDPCAVRARENFSVELRADGEPRADVSIGLMTEGSSERVFRTTDAQGRATFPIGKGGRALLFAVWLRPVDDGAAWVSDFCTLTFQVQPASGGH